VRPRSIAGAVGYSVVAEREPTGDTQVRKIGQRDPGKVRTCMMTGV